VEAKTWQAFLAMIFAGTKRFRLERIVRRQTAENLPAVAAVFAQHAAAGEEPQALVVETPDSRAQNPRISCRKATAVEPNAKLLRMELTKARNCNAHFHCA
jgi:hypothetical protein